MSKNYLISAHQRLTREWWSKNKENFRFFISTLVVTEIGKGDPIQVQKRKGLVEGIPVIETDEEIVALATFYRSRGVVAEKFFEDGLHMAIASLKGMDYLVSWNCRHIANPVIAKGILRLNDEVGHSTPLICTPVELAETQRSLRPQPKRR